MPISIEEIVYGVGNAGDDNFDNRDRDLVRLPCRDHPRRHLARGTNRPSAATRPYAIRSSLTFRCRKINEQVAHQRKREGPCLDPLSSWQSFKRLGDAADDLQHMPRAGVDQDDVVAPHEIFNGTGAFDHDDTGGQIVEHDGARQGDTDRD